LDFVLNDLNQPEAARKLAQTLQARTSNSNEIARVLIRRGDIERHVGDVEAAAKLYSEAQNALGRKAATVVKAPPAVSGGKATQASERERGRGKKEARMFSIAPSVDDWRKQAVREAACYEQLHSQLKARDIEEAQKTLDAWEMEFPLSKLAGDYPIGEGEFYTTIGDFPRALRVLSAYRKNVEISNYLPQAMALESRCLLALKRTDEFKTLAQELTSRFPGHPAAKDIQVELELLSARGKGGRLLRLEDFQ
jgi:TolA-binding protein